MDEPIPPAPPTPSVPCCSLKNKLICSSAGLIVLVIIGAAAFILGRSSAKLSSISQTLPTPTFIIATPTIDPTANWKTYTNTKYGYQIRYPEQLTAKERSSKNPSEPGLGDIIVQVTDLLLPQNQGPAHFSIQISSEDYQTIITRLENDYWGGLRESPNRAEDIKIAGIAGKKILGTQVSSGYQYLAIYFPKGNLTYTIGFIIGPEELKLGWNGGTFDQILSTFKFLDQNQADPTANWKTYQNKNGYSIKYPTTLTVVPDTGWKEPEDITEATGISVRDQSLVDPLKSPQFNLYVFSPEDTVYKGLNTSKEIADANFKENDHPETHIRTIGEVHETQFKGELAYEYTIESKGFFAGWSGFLGDQGVIKIITFKHNGKYFQIGLYDTPVFNQILSTFQFLP